MRGKIRRFAINFAAMKTLILFLVLCLTLLSISAIAQPQKTWEYKFEYNVSEKKANELGQQGWELVTIGAPGSGPTSNVETFVFKRQK